MPLAETAKLIVALSLDDKLTGPLGRVQSGLGRMGKGVGEVAGGLVRLGEVAGVAAIGGLALATKEAIDFEASMKLIQTQAGASAEEVTAMSQAVLGLAPAVGTTPEELAAGLFHVESAGFRGAEALDVLKIAAEGAKVGNADLESVTTALTGALASGVGGITNASEAMGVLNATVGAGNLRMEDLTQAFGTGILSSAKNFGVSIQSVGAAIADLARQGVPAVDAATRLRMTMSLLAAPTSKAVGLLKDIGISSTQLADDMRGPQGILGAVLDLKQHLDASGLSATEQAALLSRAFGGGRSSSAILALVGNVAELQTVQDQVNASTGQFGAAWEATQRDVRLQLDKVKAGLISAATTIGTAVLPEVADLSNEFSGFLAKPETQDRIRRFAQDVGKGIHDLAAELKGTDFSGLIGGMKIAAEVAKDAFALFRSLPGPIQQLAIAALVTNKVTGGAVGGIARGLLDIALGSLKTITAGNVTVIGANVTGGGGPGVGGTPTAGTGPLGVTGLLKALIPVAVSAAAVEELQRGRGQFSSVNDQLAALGLTAQEIARVKAPTIVANVPTGTRLPFTGTTAQIAAAIDKLREKGFTITWKDGQVALDKIDKGADAWGARLTAQATAIQQSVLTTDANERGRNNALLAAASRQQRQLEIAAAQAANIARYTAIDAAKPPPTVNVNVVANTQVSVNNVIRAVTSATIAAAGSGPGGAIPASEL